MYKEYIPFGKKIRPRKKEEGECLKFERKKA